MKWLELGFKFIPLVVAAVNGIERIFKGHGKEKQDAAVELAASLLRDIEGITAKDLLEDAEVQKALRNAIDAIVAVQNVIASVKAAKPA